MANLGQFKDKITKVQDINKITKSMELVATSKLKKISKKLLNMQQYMNEVYQVFFEIIQGTDNSLYLKDSNKEYKSTVWIVIGSSLGLCGSYNSNIIKLLKKQAKKDDLFIPINEKIVKYCKSKKMNTIDEYWFDETLKIDDVSTLGYELIEGFNEGKYDSIKIIYTKFINNAAFQEEVIDLLPVNKGDIKSVCKKEGFIFEPSKKAIFEKSIPLYIQTLLFGTIMESLLSEQVSRRVAMEAASKNGKELLEEYKTLYNKKRQELITQEITEIVAGAGAQNQ